MSMNQIGFMSKRTLQPMGYQPLRAGQFRGLGGCNVFPSNNTVINNNIMGGGMMGGCNDYSNSCCDGGGSNKALGWIIGGGFGLSLVGMICNAFGIGGGGGGAEKASDDAPVAEVDTEPVVDENEEKFKQAQRDLDSALKALGEDPTKGSVLKDADGNFKYMFNGEVFDSIDDLTKSIRESKNQPTEPAAVKPEEEAPPEEEVPPGDGGADKKASNKIKVPNRWVNNYAENANGIMPKNSTPDQIVDKFINNELKRMGFSALDDKQKAELKQEIIKYNPSVYDGSSGGTKTEANYKKLDVPGVDYVIGKFNLQRTGKPTFGQAVTQQQTPTAQKNTPDTLKTKLLSQSEGKLKNVTITENNGNYKIQGYYKGNGLFGNNLHYITVTDLNDPNIYKNLMAKY